MRQSKYFLKGLKNIPADEVSENAKILLRASYIYKNFSGVYTFLPLGQRVIDKISGIIEEEMNLIGGLKIQNSILQNKEVWEKTDRWSDEVVDNWFKTKLKNGTEIGLAFTHEEPITDLMRNYIFSYKDLPVYLYDIMKVYRNEKRAKSGLMRGREYIWKALYSFSENEKQHNEFYNLITETYLKIFDRMGLGNKTYLTFASGGTFSKYSHEFQTITEAGEDLIYIDEKKKIALNKEVYNEQVLNDLNLNKDILVEKKAVEVGNIFSLGFRFSESLDLKFKNKEGKDEYVYMGSYGIGISRLMGVIAEIYSDEKGLKWPEEVAPFQVHLLNFGCYEEAEDIYNKLIKKGVEVLWNDLDKSPGEKMAEADLIGIPIRLIVSERSLKSGGIEFKRRDEERGEILSFDKILDLI